MKKVLLILILFLSCYFIYNCTVDKKVFYLTIGDALSRGINNYGVVSYGYNDYVKDYLYSNNQLKEYNKVFTSSDYRIDNILKILEYNEQKNGYSLNRLIKQADIITISLGMNEIYYKLEINSQGIYTYIDTLINNYSKILSHIDKFHHDKVFVLGYYNSLGKSQDIINYANYKLKEISEKYQFNFLNLSQIFDNNPKYLPNMPSFIPNIEGYKKISQLIVENLQNN